MMSLSRISRTLAAAVLAAAGMAVTASATQLPLAHDLAADATQAAGTAILVFYTSDSCPYCQNVEELYLEPMLQRRTYGDRLLIRAVRADSAEPLRDFAGQRTDHAAFARRQGVYLTPLVQLYAPDGKALATPLIGYTSPDFYAGELESRIDDALARMQHSTDRSVRLPTE